MEGVIGSAQIVKMKGVILAAFPIAFFLLTFHTANGQTSVFSPKAARKNAALNARQKNLKKFIDSLNQALVVDDYEKLADLIYIPKDFETADSGEEKREKEIIAVRQMIEQTKTAGMKFNTRVASPGKIIGISGKLFSVVPQKTIIVVDKNSKIKDGKEQIIPGGRYESSGYAVAISKDDGETWRFWNEVSQENLNREFPGTIDKVKLPEIQKPYFLR